MRNTIIHSDVRQKILKSINVLIHHVREEEVNQALTCLQSLEHHFTSDLFSVNSVVFRGFVGMALDSATLSERVVLDQLKKELLGVVPSLNTYAIKHSFVHLLDCESQQAYLLLRQLYALLTSNYGSQPEDETLEEEDELREQLHDLCSEKIVATTIPQLLVTHTAQAILSLPYDYAETFDLMDEEVGFSTILPVSSQESLQEHLEYIGNMLKKIEGKKTLFIDIHILPEGFVLNLR